MRLKTPVKVAPSPTQVPHSMPGGWIDAAELRSDVPRRNAFYISAVGTTGVRVRIWNRTAVSATHTCTPQLTSCAHTITTTQLNILLTISTQAFQERARWRSSSIVFM